MVDKHESGLNRRFRTNLKMLREGLGWSQGELSRRLADDGWTVFHPTTIARIETGQRIAKIDEADALARALGGQLADLMQQPVQAVLADAEKKSRDAARDAAEAATRQEKADRRLHAVRALAAAIDGQRQRVPWAAAEFFGLILPMDDLDVDLAEDVLAAIGLDPSEVQAIIEALGSVFAPNRWLGAAELLEDAFDRRLPNLIFEPEEGKKQ